jgi:hypothetical protein
MKGLLHSITGQQPKGEAFAISEADPCLEPGWCQLSFSHLMAPSEVDYVINAVLEVACSGWQLLPQYVMHADGSFAHCRARTEANESGIDVIHRAVQNVFRPPESGSGALGKKQGFLKRVLQMIMCGVRQPQKGKEVAGKQENIQKEKQGPAAEGVTSTAGTLKAQAEVAKSVYMQSSMAAKAGKQWWGHGGEAEHRARDVGDKERARMPLRWMLLPFEAASALKEGKDLTWQGDFSNGHALKGL